MCVEMKLNVAAILFDLDNTLYDQHGAQEHIILTIARQYPDLFGNINDKAIIDAFRKADVMAIAEFNTGVSLDVVRTNRSKRLLNMLGIDKSIADEMTRKYVDGYSTVLFPIPDVKRVVGSLHTRYRIGVVTNGAPDTQTCKLASLNLTNHIDCMIFSESLGIRKPALEIFLAAARTLGVGPTDCLFVGDSYGDDIVGAKNAGMRTCWFNPCCVEEPEKKYHDVQITRLVELLDLL